MTVHHENLQVLVTEIFTVKIGLVPNIMKDVFALKEPPYNLRSESNHFTRRNVRTTYYVHLSIKHLVPQIWELIKKNFMALFYGWGSTASRLEPLRGGSLLFATKFPEISGTHFTNLRRKKG